jgi:Sec-independent protein secretion pathway component TatC
VQAAFLLMQLYAFLVPAFEPEQQRRVKPLTLAVPGLFITGVAFG